MLSKQWTDGELKCLQPWWFLWQSCDKKKSMVMDDIIMPSWIISWPLWKEDETGSQDQNGLDTSLATSINTKMSHSSLRKEDEHPEFIHAFNAYTPPGDIVGDLVFVLSWKYYASESMICKVWGHVSFSYVNYGRVEDIKKLDELGVSLKGRIAISR